MCKWDCEKGRRVGKPWKVDSPVTTLSLSPDGKTIACGTYDGSVQRWDTNGRMMEGIWTGHSNWVVALSWSPSGRRLASGSDDGTILIRKAESGEVEVGPINANQDWMWSVAYSPSGDRIASGGDYSISIWDSHTGDLLVGPIQADVRSIVWSLDGSKLYSGGLRTRVFDSTSGTELHRFQHDGWLYSTALSPQHYLLAGVGEYGIAQLWDTESYQPLGQSFYPRDSEALDCVSFSPDGRYLAYSGWSGKVTLRMVKDSFLPLPISTSTNLQSESGTPQEPVPASPSSSHPAVDATNPLAEPAVGDSEGCNDPYKTAFFTPTLFPHPSPLRKHTRMRRLRVALSRPHQPTNESRSLTHGLLSRRALSNSNIPLHALAHTDQTERTSNGKSRAGHHNEERNNVNRSDAGTAERDSDKGRQQDEPVTHNQTCTPGNLSSPDDLDSGGNRALWKSLSRGRKKDRRKALAGVTPDRSPTVVEIYAVRGFKRIIVHKRNHKTKSVAGAAIADAGGSPQAGPSSHGGAVHAQTTSEGHAWPPSQSTPVPLSAGGSLPTGIDFTDNDSCSDSSVHGPCLKFLDKICYPCGHYVDEDT